MSSTTIDLCSSNALNDIFLHWFSFQSTQQLLRHHIQLIRPQQRLQQQQQQKLDNDLQLTLPDPSSSSSESNSPPPNANSPLPPSAGPSSPSSSSQHSNLSSSGLTPRVTETATATQAKPTFSSSENGLDVVTRGHARSQQQQQQQDVPPSLCVDALGSNNVHLLDFVPSFKGSPQSSSSADNHVHVSLKKRRSEEQDVEMSSHGINHRSASYNKDAIAPPSPPSPKSLSITHALSLQASGSPKRSQVQARALTPPPVSASETSSSTTVDLSVPFDVERHGIDSYTSRPSIKPFYFPQGQQPVSGPEWDRQVGLIVRIFSKIPLGVTCVTCGLIDCHLHHLPDPQSGMMQMDETGNNAQLVDAAHLDDGAFNAHVYTSHLALSRDEFFPLTQRLCGLSSYCNTALFSAVLRFARRCEKCFRLLPNPKAHVIIDSTTQPMEEDKQNEHVEIGADAHNASLVEVEDDLELTSEIICASSVEMKDFVLYYQLYLHCSDPSERLFRLLRSCPLEQPPRLVSIAHAQTDMRNLTHSTTQTSSSSSASSESMPTHAASLVPAIAPMRYLSRGSFQAVISEVVARHPGLEFLEATPEFQMKYAQTVVARIFYSVNTTGNERLTLAQLRHSNLLLMLSMLDSEDDINKLNDYFSYEHFYVIYCKFWELDSDHDGLVDINDLMSYDDYSLTSKIVERVIQGYGRPLLSGQVGKMNYNDFVIFLISEVDKSNPVSLQYWFSCLDLDGDGVINAYEMDYFFEEQKIRIQTLSQEQINFSDIFCQLIDMIKNQGGQVDVMPESNVKRASHSIHAIERGSVSMLSNDFTSARPIFTRHELKTSKLAGAFFNTLFNLQKFILSEQRDPMRIKQIHETPQLSDWDRYAISGYFRLSFESESDVEEETAIETDEDDDSFDMHARNSDEAVAASSDIEIVDLHAVDNSMDHST